MTENENARQVLMQRVYLRDASLEAPGAPEVFKGQWQPQMDVQINTGAEPIPGDEAGLWQVVLTVTLTAKQDDKVAYIVEVQQAGLFSLKGFQEGEQQSVLATFCPTQLLPFAREVIADLISRGGFGQFLLQPVNFDAVYAEHQRQVSEAAEQSEASVKH